MRDDGRVAVTENAEGPDSPAKTRGETVGKGKKGTAIVSVSATSATNRYSCKPLGNAGLANGVKSNKRGNLLQRIENLFRR